MTDVDLHSLSHSIRRRSLAVLAVGVVLNAAGWVLTGNLPVLLACVLLGGALLAVLATMRVTDRRVSHEWAARHAAGGDGTPVDAQGQ
jgi:hypothetical protein